MTQRDPEWGETYPRADVARLLGLRPDDVADDVPVQAVSTGVSFVVTPLRSLAAVRAVHPDFAAIRERLAKTRDRAFYLVTRETQDANARLHARYPFERGEDPATGSAAGCACAWMVRHGVAAAEEQVVIEQGLEIQRPSQLFVRSARDGERVRAVRVGGFAVPVMNGEYRLR